MVRASNARQRMLDAALDLFHRKGVRGTRVEEILEQSNTGKSQLYHYFGSKDGLVEAAVSYFESQLVAGRLPGTQTIETLADLEEWFGAFIAYQYATGSTRHCPMATIHSTLDEDEQEPIRVAIRRVFQHARRALDEFFERLARDGRLPPDCAPRTLTDFCATVMQGGLILSRVRGEPAPFESAVDHAMRYLRSIVRE